MEDWRLLAVAGLGVVMAATVVVVSSSMTVVDLFVLGLGCVSSGCGARLVQGRYLQWRRKSGGGARSAIAGDGCAIRALRLLVGCLVVTALLVLSKRRSELPDGLLELLWFVLTAAVTSVGLAAAFELCGTSKPELADALSEKQISFSEGAAWLFFLGYLEVIFGEHGKSFSSRMEDFLTQNEISEEDRQSACTEKMFIIVPMTHKALLPDRDIHVCDRNVQRYSEQVCPLLGRGCVSVTVIRNPGFTIIHLVLVNGKLYILLLAIDHMLSCRAFQFCDFLHSSRSVLHGQLKLHFSRVMHRLRRGWANRQCISLVFPTISRHFLK